MHCMAKPWGWDIQGIPSLPSCLPWCWWCLLGDCKHVAGDWRWHWGWCEDVAALRGWSTRQTLLGFGSWGQPGLIRPACHIMVRFILSDALQWSLLVEEGDLPLHPSMSGCPGLLEGSTESGTLWKRDEWSVLAEWGDRGIQVNLSDPARSQVCTSVLCTRPPEPLERYWGRSHIPLIV